MGRNGWTLHHHPARTHASARDTVSCVESASAQNGCIDPLWWELSAHWVLGCRIVIVLVVAGVVIAVYRFIIVELFGIGKPDSLESFPPFAVSAAL